MRSYVTSCSWACWPQSRACYSAAFGCSFPQFAAAARAVADTKRGFSRANCTSRVRSDSLSYESGNRTGAWCLAATGFHTIRLWIYHCMELMGLTL